MFGFPSLPIKSTLCGLIVIGCIIGWLYVKDMEANLAQKENTILIQQSTITSIQDQIEKYKKAEEVSVKLQKEKEAIEQSFSGVEQQLEQLKKKAKANVCKPIKKDEVDGDRIITDDINSLLNTSDCISTGKQDCSSPNTQGRVHHIYTVE